MSKGVIQLGWELWAALYKRVLGGALLGGFRWSDPALPASRSQAKRILAGICRVDGVTGGCLWSVPAEAFVIVLSPAALLRAGVGAGRERM